MLWRFEKRESGGMLDYSLSPFIHCYYGDELRKALNAREVEAVSLKENVQEAQDINETLLVVHMKSGDKIRFVLTETECAKEQLDSFIEVWEYLTKNK
jgi:hypothetical protein